MHIQTILFPIILPLISAVLVLLVPRKVKFVREIFVVIATLSNLFFALQLFHKEAVFSHPWGHYGIDFSLKLYSFNSFILAAAAGFAFLISIYASVFMFSKEKAWQFFAYFLFSLSFVNGAILSDNLILLLFFWEGLLLSIFGLIAIGNKNAFKTAVKALIIVGVTDLCMMVGIALTGHLSGTFAISEINLSLEGLGILAFVLMAIGAIAKAGSMPFHSWIPDAAVDSPLPFMAFLPAALEKLLGIYLLARISLDMFKLLPDSGMSMFLMVVGAITILFAVMMALIQKDYKKLLSYHAISQVGYMILGIGTALPVGIAGGLFHMINHAMYKSCLFLTGGSVERQAGTTNLELLGGLGKKMPITFICFLVAAASISGVPPFNGFFSKELVYDAALERGLIFYLAAIVGSFFTAASFLKLGHAVYLGKSGSASERAKEAPAPMLIAMIVIAAGCVFFGINRAYPLGQLIQPIFTGETEGHDFASMIPATKLVIVTIIVILVALLNHIMGYKIKGSGLKAVDYIHDAPVLRDIYDAAEKKYLDPCTIGFYVFDWFSKVLWRIDRVIDWVYNSGLPKLAFGISGRLRALHTGNYATYLSWSIAGLLIIIVFLISAKGF